MKENYKGILYAILSSVAFGLMPIFAKVAYGNGSNPTTVLFYRFLISAIILFIYLKIKKVEIKIDKRSAWILILIGFIGYTVTTQTLFMSYNYLGVGFATTLHFIYPAVVCVIGFFFLKEKISKRKLIALILAGCGVYSLVAFENNTISAMGVILAISSGITYGLNVILLGIKSLKHIDNRVRTMYVSLGAFAGMLIYGICNNSIIYELNFKLLLCYIGIALVSTIFSIVLLLKAMEIIGAGTASILSTFEPIVSIILGIIIFGEEFTVALFIGAIFILGSTILLVKDK